jgi:hypothetical protein
LSHILYYELKVPTTRCTDQLDSSHIKQKQNNYAWSYELYNFIFKWKLL